MGLLGKILKKSPIGKKLIKADPVARKLTGGGKKTGGMGQRAAGALGNMGKMKTGGPGQVSRPMARTGGPAQAVKTKNAQRMSDFARPRGKRPAY